MNYNNYENEARRIGEKYRRGAYLNYKEREFVRDACRHDVRDDLEYEFREGARLSPWERCDFDRR